MSKGLEAFKDLMYYSACFHCQYHIDKECSNKDECCWKTIEKELKEYYKLKEEIMKCSCWKEHKALKIIKKYISVNKPFESACYINLNDESEMISEEEYDLLKEVML